MRIFLKPRVPVLAIYQICLMLLSVPPMPKFDYDGAIRMVRYHQRGNDAAYLSHRKGRLVRFSANLAL
jgi:hypothetical protein